MTEEFGRNHAGEISRAPASRRNESPVHVVRLARVDSTNREAERIIAEDGGPQGPVVVVATEQTAGEGRRGAAWSSPAGGLWVTIAWPLSDGSPGDAILEGLGLRLGLACLRTVRTIAPDARLKWPNDVLVSGKKVCGCMARLLAGSGGGRRILAAAGINANNPIPPSLADLAASLRQLTASEVDLRRLEHHLLEHLQWALTTPGVEPEMVAEANRNLAGIGEPIRLRDAGESVAGDLLGLGDSGTPRVRLPDGRVIEVGPGAETIHGP